MSKEPYKPTILPPEEVIDKMVKDIKQREEWNRNRKLREAVETIVVVIGTVLFLGWLVISIWFAVNGITDNACTSVSGDAFYCGE